MPSRAVAAATLLSMLLVACGGGGETVASDSPASPGPGEAPGPPGDPRFTATATVLESPAHGPQLCLGGVMESYPPQCGGPDVVGWDWTDLEGVESAGGTTWGTYAVVGTWDGERLTLTEPPTVPRADEGDAEPGADGDRFATPCDPPPGGWAVVDPATATEEGQQAALADARAQPDFAGAWVDQSINPAHGSGGTDDPGAAAALNDPTLLILNLRFTGDLDRHEAAARAVWGGPLCLSEAAVSLSELTAIQAEVSEGPDVLWSSADEVRGVVEVGVVLAGEAEQAEVDQRYGPGVVELVSALQPVP